MPRHLESIEQRLFVQRFRLDPSTRDLPACAIPNGGRRGAREAGILKAEGVTAGAPDWVLMVPRGPFCGLALEFKAPVGPVRVSLTQQSFLTRLAHHGWSVHIVRNAHDAWQHVAAYLTLDIA
jgi:hypothetical protein